MKHILIVFIACPFLFACGSRTELSKEDSTVDKAQTYNLVEKRQRVIRYDCNDQVTSDKIESVTTPIEHMSIKPAVTENLYLSEIDNLTLGTHAGSIANFTDFTIDLNPGLLNLEVKIGTNEIAYRFYYCDHLIVTPESTSCAKPAVLRETGSVFINVSYENIDITENLVVKPDPTQCTTIK